MGGTLDRCKERCSGDFNFVQNNAKEFKDLPGAPNAGSAAAAGKVAQSPGLQGRTWFSSVLMFDEIYDFLMELGVLDTPSSAARRQSSCGDVSGQTPNSGWANRLLQTGLSVHETKTCGSFGGLHIPSVNTSLAGNFHPNVAVEMMRGIRGDHGCQTKARMFFVTGKPIQPHEEFASHGVCATKEWCPLPDVLQQLLRLECLSTPEAAAAHLGHEDDLVMGEAVFSEDGFFPHAIGWKYLLPDGVSTQIRFRRGADGEACVPEWSMAVREIAVPDEFRLDQAAKRLVNTFAADHRQLKFSSEAKKIFKSYQAYFNIMVVDSRQGEDIGQAAQMGACPWKLAMLASALALWDISWEQHEGADLAAGAEHIEISESVVARAFGLLEILESIVAIMSGTEDGSSSTFSAFTTAAEKRKRVEEESVADLKGTSVEDRHWEPRAQFSGMFDTVLFRRLLSKAEPSTEATRFVVKAKQVYQVTRRHDKLDRSIVLADFRGLATAASTQLVSYDSAKDCFYFDLADEPTPEFEAALMAHANVSVAALRSMLASQASKKKARRSRLEETAS